MASLFRLGHEIVLSKEEELEEELAHDWNTTESISTMTKDFIKIRLWKMASFTTSTIPYVEAMSSHPSGCLKYDHIDSDDGHIQFSQSYFDADDKPESEEKSNQQKFNYRKHFTVKWTVSYILDVNANVSLFYF